MNTQPSPSLLPGTMIIAGASIGGGMFALPMIAAGMWFPWTMVCLVVLWWLNYRAAFLIVETGMRYPVGASFDSYVSESLGRAWNAATGLSIVALLYTLMYAYFSGVSSLATQFLADVSPNAATSTSVTLGVIVALLASSGSRAVGRTCVVLLAGMGITFVMATSGLLQQVQIDQLFRLESEVSYYPYVFVALPVLLTSFGASPVVPSLIRLYGHAPDTINRCIFLGSGLTMVVYVLWCGAVFGNLPRDVFPVIMQSNESIGGLVVRLEAVADTPTLSVVFNLFSVLAVVSSFLTVGLSLTDYLVDRLNLGAGIRGRVLATLIAFAPPAILSALFPYGFVAAIGLAGLLMVLGLFVVPVLMSRRNRARPGSFATATITNSNWVLVAVLLGSLVVAICHVLEMQGLLPNFVE